VGDGKMVDVESHTAARFHCILRLLREKDAPNLLRPFGVCRVRVGQVDGDVASMLRSRFWLTLLFVKSTANCPVQECYTTDQARRTIMPTGSLSVSFFTTSSKIVFDFYFVQIW
jgi:hypothetical protein